MKVIIPTRVVTFNRNELTEWVEGNREHCTDTYCKKLVGSRGFGEFVAGRYYERLGYEWIHHDFNLFGGNKLGKYPKAERVFRKYFSDERFEKARGYFDSFYPFVKIEEPDLMVYNPDYSKLFFAECKRMDTGDKINDKQVKGLALLKLLFDCHVEIVWIIEEGKNKGDLSNHMTWEF